MPDRYTCLFAPALPGNAHRVFRNDSQGGRIELADYSGADPSHTDDGPCVVLCDQDIEVLLHVAFGKRPFVACSIPVRVERTGRRGLVWVTGEVAQALKQHIPGLRFVPNEAVRTMVRQVHSLCQSVPVFDADLQSVIAAERARPRMAA